MISNSNRIVIKIGSALIADISGNPKTEWVNSLASDINILMSMKKEVVLVSSGAVALGKRHIQIVGRPHHLEDKQAAAAIGQIKLSQAHSDALSSYGVTAAQILISAEDFENRRRYLNGKNTLLNLLRHKAVPVINENDTVATDELRVGDNDRLAARVASMIGADLLILLSDIDGLYKGDPRKNSNVEFVPVIEHITKEIESYGGNADSSGLGTGGMATKIAAAKIAARGGCATIIAFGEVLNPLMQIINGARHSLFRASGTPISARQKWIADSLASKGELVINQCAVKALLGGSSLLAIGILSLTGNFHRGDNLVIKNESGDIIGKGLSNYDSAEIALILGKKSDQIEAILGTSNGDEVIHRDSAAIS